MSDEILFINELLVFGVDQNLSRVEILRMAREFQSELSHDEIQKLVDKVVDYMISENLMEKVGATSSQWQLTSSGRYFGEALKD